MPYREVPCTIFTVYMSNDVVSHRDVPLRGENKISHFDLHSPKTLILSQFLTGLEKIRKFKFFYNNYMIVKQPEVKCVISLLTVHWPEHYTTMPHTNKMLSYRREIVLQVHYNFHQK